MRKLGVTAALVVAGLLASAHAASASTTLCTGLIGPGTFDNILVPPGADCVVFQSTVHDVKAREHAFLVVFQSTVLGHIEGQKADVVQILKSTVTGDITIDGGRGLDDVLNEVTICETTLNKGNIRIHHKTGSVDVGGPTCEALFYSGNLLTKGGIEVRENKVADPDVLSVESNEVHGNVMVDKNKGDGAKAVEANTISGNLECTANAPAFIGGPQTSVGGKTKGQCTP